MENEQKNPVKLFGLIGKNISYSFSRGYFTEKFRRLRLKGHLYKNFDISSIENFPAILREYPGLKGLNVTIPYKEKIIPYLTDLSEEAAIINAVNTITFTKNGLKGHNTDYYGFKRSFVPLLKPHHKKALILGTGGASKAIAYTLDSLEIPYSYVSRSAPGMLLYSDLNKEIIQSHTIIINCTPLGTTPKIDVKPNIPYQFITSEHLLYDLIYNPAVTAFMASGNTKEATTCNGLAMLQFQAEKAWEIWNT